MKRRDAFDAAGDNNAKPEPPRRLRYACAARDCPMPGVIFEGGSELGVCAWHYRELPSRWPHITEIITDDWGCVARCINFGRTVLCDQKSGCDARAIATAFNAQEALLRDQVADVWWQVLQPGGASYAQWIRRLERFLDSRIHDSRRTSPFTQSELLP